MGLIRLQASSLPAGSVLQTVQAVKSDTQSTTSITRVDVSGLSVNITPTSASSKILVMLDVAVGTAESTGSLGAVHLMRDSTDIYIGDAASNRARITAQIDNSSGDMSYNITRNNAVYLDSPATTSQITYKVQFKTYNGANAVHINQSGNDTDVSYINRLASSITVMEIAG
jgi:hypothetical protein